MRRKRYGIFKRVSTFRSIYPLNRTAGRPCSRSSSGCSMHPLAPPVRLADIARYEKAQGRPFTAPALI